MSHDDHIAVLEGPKTGSSSAPSPIFRIIVLIAEVVAFLTTVGGIISWFSNRPPLAFVLVGLGVVLLVGAALASRSRARKLFIPALTLLCVAMLLLGAAIALSVVPKAKLQPMPTCETPLPSSKTVKGTITQPTGKEPVNQVEDVKGTVGPLQSSQTLYVVVFVVGPRLCEPTKLWPAHVSIKGDGTWYANMALGGNGPASDGLMLRIMLVVCDKQASESIERYSKATEQSKLYPGIAVNTITGSIEAIDNVAVTRNAAAS